MKLKILFSALFMSLLSSQQESHAMIRSMGRFLERAAEQASVRRAATSAVLRRSPVVSPAHQIPSSQSSIILGASHPTFSIQRFNLRTLFPGIFTRHFSSTIRLDAQLAQISLVQKDDGPKPKPFDGPKPFIELEKKTFEPVLLLDSPILESNEYIKDYLIHNDSLHRKAAFDHYKTLVSARDIESLEHAHNVSYILTHLDKSSALRIVPRLFLKNDSVYRDIHEAYLSGCRLANLSLSIDIAYADLNQLSADTLRAGREKFSEYLMTHLAGTFFNVVESLSEEKLSVEARDQWLGFFFRSFDEDESVVQSLAETSGLSQYAVSFVNEFKNAAKVKFIPGYQAVSVEKVESAIVDHPDMLFVMAAGNEGYNLDLDNPAIQIIQKKKYPNVLVVASVDSNGALSSFSNYGQSTVHVAAPGNGLEVMTFYGQPRVVSGTSFAVPQVVNLVAKMRLIDSTLNPVEIKQILEKTVRKDPVLQDRLVWNGVIDENAALEEVRRGRPYFADKPVVE